ncbi:hypothetical protein HYV10_00315 [Candidatus Dependentiae bacterium]|nr:hypothetical protein [Candidatus Dependentiae bacterium]
MKYQGYLNYSACVVGIIFLMTNDFIYSDMQADRCINKQVAITDQEILEKDYSLDLDDEKLVQEIFEIFSGSYKDIIDLTALYFCGLVDSDKLYGQIITSLHKDFFKVLKLFSWYIPAIFKNKNISTFIKIKKSIYVACCIIIFWYGSKEILYAKMPAKELKLEIDTELFNRRNRPKLDL